MEEKVVVPATRFSGADWASELRDIVLVGTGGIGSWLALNLSRIGHSLNLFDMDMVDETNVTGGQMFRKTDIGKPKVGAVMQTCRDFGCTNRILTIVDRYAKNYGVLPITITGLDNMAARKTVFEAWKESISQEPGLQAGALLLDGRLTTEMFEVLAVQWKPEQLEEYEKDYLFSDDEAEILDCTNKQSTFSAMGIASLMTATLCNFLTNRKLGMDFREVPFYQRIYYPAMELKQVIDAMEAERALIPESFQNQ